MNPETPSTDYDASALGPGKRKRGRPRKHPMLEDQSPTFGEDAQIMRNLNLYAGGNINMPPRLQVNGNQPRSVGSVQASNDIPIGQIVSGVIEASFDGGYLLSVRAGKSGTPMRGVVFKPGCYVPVSAENDVAPDVKMIRRSEIRPPVENLSNLHASGGLSREKNGAAYHPASFSSSPLTSRGSKQLPLGSPPTTCPTPSRGNTIPIALQPISPSNGSIIINQTHTVAVQDARLSAVSWLPPPVPIQGYHSQNGMAVATAGTAEGAPNQSLGGGSQPCIPFENLVTEVIQRIQLPTQADGNQNESSKMDGKSSCTLEDDVSNGNDQPLFIEPLQTRQPLLAGHPNIIPHQLDLERSAKMTQLLQENAARNVFLQTQNKLD